jgi:hypothetical protein
METRGRGYQGELRQAKNSTCLASFFPDMQINRTPHRIPICQNGRASCWQIQFSSGTSPRGGHLECSIIFGAVHVKSLHSFSSTPTSQFYSYCTLLRLSCIHDSNNSLMVASSVSPTWLTLDRTIHGLSRSVTAPNIVALI